MTNKISIFGVGAAGSNLLLNLVCAFPDLNYQIFDFDFVEERNIRAGTQPYSKSDLGRPKVQALQKIVYFLRNKKIDMVNQKITKQSELKTHLDKTTLAIDCFDNANSRNLFIGLKTPILHVGFSDKLTGEVVWNELFTPITSSKADATIDICRNHLARPFIFGLTSLASLVVSKYIEKKEKQSLYFDSFLRLKLFK